jgi:hypothetical protein
MTVAGWVLQKKNAKDIPVLTTGIEHSVTPESNFSTKEHPSLLAHTGKTVKTPLTSTLSARYIKLPTNPKDSHYTDRHTLASIKKNTLTLTFRGHRDGKVLRIEWDQYYLHLSREEAAVFGLRDKRTHNRYADRVGGDWRWGG